MELSTPYQVCPAALCTAQFGILYIVWNERKRMYQSDNILNCLSHWLTCQTSIEDSDCRGNVFMSSVCSLCSASFPAIVALSFAFSPAEGTCCVMLCSTLIVLDLT